MGGGRQVSLDRPSFVNSLDGCPRSTAGFITLIMSTISFFAPPPPVLTKLTQTKHTDCKWNWSPKGTCRLCYNYRPILTALQNTQRHKNIQMMENECFFLILLILFMTVYYEASNINIVNICLYQGCWTCSRVSHAALAVLERVPPL
jgi:hypothetical protein